MRRGNSPWPALMAKCRSAWAVYVGRPVAGPGRCPSTTTMGSSAWPARLRPSTMRAKPPPEVPTAARSPAYACPSAIMIGGDLALRLHHLELEARRLPGQVVQQAAGRRHRVAGVRLEAAADEPQPGGLQPGHHRPRPAAGQIDEQLLRGEVEPAPRHPQVELRLFVLVAVDDVLERLPGDGDGLAERAEDGAVAHHARRLFLCQDRLHGDPRPERVRHARQARRRDALAVEHRHRPLLEPPVVALQRVRVRAIITLMWSRCAAIRPRCARTMT